jgi:hypothetical protein
MPADRSLRHLIHVINPKERHAMTTIRTFVASTVVLMATLAACPAWAQAPPAEVPPMPQAPPNTLAPTPDAPTAAAPMPPPPQAKFYELTENMKMVNFRLQSSRVAVSALAGKAAVGNPFCPAGLALSYNPNAISCDVTALGSDSVNPATGLGNFRARISIVVQGDNPVDSPELVVDRIKVNGLMDFSPALTGGLPYGTVKGKVLGHDDTETDGHPKFVGVFRMPFLASPAIRASLCPLTPNPNPNFPGWDVAYLDTTQTGAPTGRCIDIRSAELSLGTPTVRFDIWFIQ